MDLDLKFLVTRLPRHEKSVLAGDRVWANQVGEGVVVGFTAYTDNPMVYFYTRQEVVCISDEDLKRVIF